MKPHASVRDVFDDESCPIACAQHVVCIAEQVCVAATATFPANVEYYVDDKSANSAGISNRCSVARGQITQQYNETCALKCKDGFQGNPVLYCAANPSKTIRSGSPIYKSMDCIRTCDRLHGSNDSVK